MLWISNQVNEVSKKNCEHNREGKEIGAYNQNTYS